MSSTSAARLKGEKKMKRKLFCQLSPTAYRISVAKCRAVRHLKNLSIRGQIARRKEAPLPCVIYRHNSLIRRQLGNVDMQLQENKAVNLRLAAPQVSGIVIRPGEIFSFWSLVGNATEKRGFREGLTISNGGASHGVGGGMCQFTNLIHWMILHTPMTIIEHHHHDGMDLFPDFNRQIPFGTGTSIVYNYLDYRFQNTTDQTFQLITWTDEKYLCGELRSDRPLPVKYHIKTEHERFIEGDDGEVYRLGEVWRECVDKRTGQVTERVLIKDNHAKICYDRKYVTISPE